MTTALPPDLPAPAVGRIPRGRPIRLPRLFQTGGRNPPSGRIARREGIIHDLVDQALDGAPVELRRSLAARLPGWKVRHVVSSIRYRRPPCLASRILFRILGALRYPTVTAEHSLDKV